MIARSIESRLEKLESVEKGQGRFIVMTCQNSGTMEGAKAFFEDETGIELQSSDDLVLMHRFYEGEPNDGSALPPLYEILTHLDAGGLSQVMREVDGKTRGLPRHSRSN